MPKEKRRKANNTAEDEVFNELRVEIFGVTMLFPKKKKVVMPNGVKSRISIDKKTPIPPHVAFIAFETGRYVRPENLKPAISFGYDLEGDGEKETRFDGFLLDGDRVWFEGVADRKPEFAIDNVPTTSTLGTKLQLCPAVLRGASKQVIGTIDLSNAKSIVGKDHGDHSAHPITFGTQTKNWAEKLVAVFERNGGQPVVHLTNGKEPVEFELRENASVIMVGNVPAQELLKLIEEPEGDVIPMSHIELVLDLFHLSAGAALCLPSHPPAPAHSHAAPSMPTGAARCGPPLQVDKE